MQNDRKPSVDVVPEGIDADRWRQILELEANDDLNLFALPKSVFEIIITDRIYSNDPINPSAPKR